MLNKSIKKFFQDSSGGSTGEPIIIYKDKNFLYHSFASELLTLSFCGWKPGYKIAKLWGASRDNFLFQTLKGKVLSFFQNIKIYDTFDLSESRLWQIHQELQNWKPDIIVAYASSMYLFAKFLEENKIKPDYPKISIMTSAETLYPYMREKIECVFHKKVFDKYGSREVSTIACECEKHNGLHIFMDNVIVECIDSKGNELYDEPGELIITDLNNYALPLIRYRIGDMGVLTKEKCDCGRNTLKLKN